MSKTTATAITPEHSKAITTAAWRTWEIIGSDCYALCEEHGERMTNAAAVEQVIEYMEWYTKVNPMGFGYTYDQIVKFLKKEKFVY